MKNRIAGKIPLLILLAAAFLCLGVLLIRPAENTKTESHLQPRQKIVPVLYYETFDGLKGYDTHTVLIDNNTAKTLEKHYRTWSKTYPSSAEEKVGGASSVRSTYGQWMIYYKTLQNELFLFDRAHTETAAEEFFLLKDEFTAAVPKEKNQSFFDLLFFDGCYYLFTLLPSAPTAAEPGIIRIYKLTEGLAVKDIYDVDFRSLGLSTHSFVDFAVAVIKDIFLAPVHRGGDYYLLCCNLENGTTDLLPVDDRLLGIVADTDSFYTIGLAENNEIVFEKFTPTGESVSKNSLPLPFETAFDNIHFDKIFYQYGSDIYWCFQDSTTCYFLSYNIETAEWSNTWAVEMRPEPSVLMDVKYMLKENGNYYDLYPNWNNVK